MAGETKVTPNEIKAVTWQGNITGLSITVAAQTVASQALPTTSVNHKYLCICNVEIQTGGGTGREYYGQIVQDSTERMRAYFNSTTGDWLCQIPLNYIVTASSGTVYFKVGETAGPGGSTVNRGNWCIVDLGVA